MSIKTQGTHLFYVTPGDTPAIVKLHCPTGVTGLGGAADQIDTTCLDQTKDRTYTRGLGNPGQVTIPINFDPAQLSHQDIFDLKDGGETLQWVVGFSDGVSPPTLTNGVMVPSTDRTNILFDAYVSDFSLDFAGNDIVKGTLTLQRSGAVTLIGKA